MNVKTPLLIAALAAVAMSGRAAAAEAESKTKPVTKAEKKAKSETAAAPAGMTAFKDPKTGALRGPEHDDSQKLAAQAAQDKAGKAKLRGAIAPELREMAGPEGAVGVTLDDTFMSAIVATVGADGKVKTQHVSNLAAAPAETKAARPTEDRHDQ
jgi:hypothetical protein